MPRARTTATVVTLIAVLASACSSGSTKSDSPPKADAQLLTILVTNDDGYAAPGIAVVAAALAKLPHTKVVVVAPAENKSGTGGSTTPGTLTATKHQTANGLPATAVNGFPADAVRYAYETLHVKPDVVVSGINAGQNLGPITDVSGTVGAAKAAATRGTPAIAASQGTGERYQYAVGARLVVRWVTARRAQLASGAATVGVVNLNIPSCPGGLLRGIKQVPLATTTDGAVAPSDCSSTVTDVADDIAAFHNAFASVTQLDAAGETVTASTTFPAR